MFEKITTPLFTGLSYEELNDIIDKGEAELAAGQYNFGVHEEGEGTSIGPTPDEEQAQILASDGVSTELPEN